MTSTSACYLRNYSFSSCLLPLKLSLQLMPATIETIPLTCTYYLQYYSFNLLQQPLKPLHELAPTTFETIFNSYLLPLKRLRSEIKTITSTCTNNLRNYSFNSYLLPSELLLLPTPTTFKTFTSTCTNEDHALQEYGFRQFCVSFASVLRQ